MPQDIFEAASTGNVDALRDLVKEADLAAVDTFGFTVLHRAAMATGLIGQTSTPLALEKSLAVLELLVEASSSLEALSEDGRTALYLAAEFSTRVEPVQLLLNAGAEADIQDGHGNHIVVNAMQPEVQALLSKATGKSVPLPPSPRPKPVKLKAAEWQAAKARFDPVFDQLSGQGLVVLQDAGTTQSDGLDDCFQIFAERGGADGGLIGFCFYSREDQNRAKRTAELVLSFWAAPSGDSQDMERVGQIVCNAFAEAGFFILWNGSEATRPSVFLSTDPI